MGGEYHHASREEHPFRRFARLTASLVVREWKSRYRRSVLGPGWAILQPLGYMVVFTFLRAVMAGTDPDFDYALFTFSALVPWSFFQNAVLRAGPSVIANRAIIKKMHLRREVFPLSGVLISLVDFACAFVILLGIMLAAGRPLSWTILWVVPLVLLTGLLALGVGFLFSAFGAYKRDFLFGTPFLMQFWMILSPIMYEVGKVPERWRGLFALNPLAGLIGSFRDVVVGGAPPEAGLLLRGMPVLVAALAGGWLLYRYMSQYFADDL